MSRLLFLAAIAIVVYLVLRSLGRRAPHQGQPGRTEDMVRCAYCGVHLPKSESILTAGKYYCSDAHRRADQSSPPNQNGG